jgi:hypothetical protein
MKHTSKKRVLKNNTFKHRIMKGGSNPNCEKDLLDFRRKLFELAKNHDFPEFVKTYKCYERTKGKKR